MDRNDKLEMESIPGKTKSQIEIEQATEELREEYFEKNGKWPEEDGQIIKVNFEK